MAVQRHKGVHDNRIGWLDNVRGFAICMIVLAHVLQYFPVARDLNSFICGFHVSIFFVVSGCLAFLQKDRQESLAAAIRKRAKTLLVPYIVFSIFNFLVKGIVFLIQGKYTVEILRNELVELFITGNGTVWFLTTLFFAEILYLLLKKAVGTNFYFYLPLMLLFGILPFLLNAHISPLMVLVKRIFMALAFYYAGFFLMMFINAGWMKKWREILVAAVCLYAGFWAWKTYGSEMAYYEANFSGGWASAAVNLMLSAGFVLLLKAIPGNRFLRYLGRNSLVVMLIHPLLLMCYVYPIGFPVDQLSYMQQRKYILVVFLALIVLQIPFIEFMNKYMPRMIGKEKRHD